MLTRRKLLTNGIPAVAGFSAAALAVSEPVEPSLESLVEWAKQNRCHVRIRSDGTCWVEWGNSFRRYAWGVDLRAAITMAKRIEQKYPHGLLAAKAEIEKGA